MRTIAKRNGIHRTKAKIYAKEKKKHMKCVSNRIHDQRTHNVIPFLICNQAYTTLSFKSVLPLCSVHTLNSCIEPISGCIKVVSLWMQDTNNPTNGDLMPKIYAFRKLLVLAWKEGENDKRGGLLYATVIWWGKKSYTHTNKKSTSHLFTFI